MNKTNAELRKRLSRLNKTNVEVEKRMSWLSKRNTEYEKRRLYVKTTNKLNLDRKNESKREGKASFSRVNGLFLSCYQERNIEKVQLSLEANAPTAETASLLISLLDQLISDCRLVMAYDFPDMYVTVQELVEF